MRTPITVVLIASPVRLRRWQARLAPAPAGFQLLAPATSVATLLQGQRKPARIVLCDLTLARRDDGAGIAALRDAWPDCRILLGLPGDSPGALADLLEHGACGCVALTATRTAAWRLLATIAAGGVALPDAVVTELLARLQQRRRPRSDRVRNLTAREREILHQLAQGRQYKEVARAIGISLDTVRTHVRRLYGKLGVNNRTDAIRAAQPAG